MRYYDSDCVSCGLPCIYEACPYYKVPHFVCDLCKDEDVRLYHYNGLELCGDCILREFDLVEGTEEFI